MYGRSPHDGRPPLFFPSAQLAYSAEELAPLTAGGHPPGGVVRPTYGDAMHARSRPHGRFTPALADVNGRIRRLMMTEPDGYERREAYRLLLEEWGALTRDAVEPAA